MSQRVDIVDYDPKWPIWYEEEKQRVLEAIGHKVVAVEHIGSTSVSGLGAKPIIDMMAGVQGPAEADQCIPLLRRIGYTSFTPEPDNPDHYYCCGKGPHSIGYHLHLVRFKSQEWEKHLIFRDYLRIRRSVAQEYYELKKKLARRHDSDRAGYTSAKASFIQSALSQAHEYIGIGQFGPAYQSMLENDTHAPGSVDRTLAEQMVKLCCETAEYLYSVHTRTQILYRRGSRPQLELYVGSMIDRSSSNEKTVERIAQFTSQLQEKAESNLDKVRIGGLEEDIIGRGSDWCTDLARVSCVLCQVAELPARLVTLVDVEKAYSAHVITEVYRFGVWGAVDSTTNVVYRHEGGNPATTWELMNDPELLELHWRRESTPYTNKGQFRTAAISNYFVWQWKEYDYTASGINDYYRSILEMADKGWPGGLRWLHGEERHNIT